MRELGTQLRSQGFQVVSLLGSGPDKSKATKQGIERAIKSFASELRKLDKQDIVIVALAGHGQQRVVKGREDAFFCPADAHVNDSQTWVSISQLMTTLNQSSGSTRNLVLIDACRNNPTRGVDGKNVQLLKDNMAILFAASYGEKEQEVRKLTRNGKVVNVRHGLFTYHVLNGLRGAARDRDNEVTWDSTFTTPGGDGIVQWKPLGPHQEHDASPAVGHDGWQVVGRRHHHAAPLIRPLLS